MEMVSGIISQRYKAIDLLRSFAVILVLVGHSVQIIAEIVNPGSSVRTNIIYRGIYFFHMPLFIMISGFLFRGTLRRKKRSAILKSDVVFLRTVLIWSTITTVIKIVLGYTQNVSVSEIIKMFFITYWFLWAILLYRLISMLVYEWKKPINWLFIVLLIGFALVHPSRGIIIQDYFFFIIGMCLGKLDLKRINDKIEKNAAVYFAGSLSISLIIILIYLNSTIWASDTVITIFNSAVQRDLKGIAIGLVSAIICYIAITCFIVNLYIISCCISKLIKNHNIYEYISMNSMEYYLVQGIILETIIHLILHRYCIAFVTKHASISALISFASAFVIVSSIIMIIKKMDNKGIVFGK